MLDNSFKHRSGYAGLLICMGVFAYLYLKVNFMVGLAFALFPMVLGILFILLKNPYWPLTAFFYANYFLMGVARYVPIPSIGLMADALLILTLVVLVFSSGVAKVDWSLSHNGYMVACLIWLLYCLLQLTNPSASFQAWSTSVRFMAFYAVFVALLVPIVFRRNRDLDRIVLLWSVFTLVAAFKGFYQKEVGFDSAEMRWLYVEGKASTHILATGTRYFSIFTDAANFGSGMGMSMVAFMIIGLQAKSARRKAYYLLVGLVAGYAMMISGTRSAMVIPFAGFFFFILISKNWKAVVYGSFVVAMAFVFFSMTTMGQGNAQIRRMRSAFHSEQDASYLLRKANKAKIKVFMNKKPFGVGVGMGGGKATSHASDSFSTQIATDSWVVVLWMETGLVGLSLYILLFLYFQIKGALIVLKIKNERLKGILGAFLAAIFGIMVSSYSNEVIAQFPNGIVIFVCQAFVFMGADLDQEAA